MSPRPSTGYSDIAPASIGMHVIEALALVVLVLMAFLLAIR